MHPFFVGKIGTLPQSGKPLSVAAPAGSWSGITGVGKFSGEGEFSTTIKKG